MVLVYLQWRNNFERNILQNPRRDIHGWVTFCSATTHILNVVVHLHKPMNKTIIIILFLALISCNKKPKAERKLSDFFTEKDEMTLNAQKTDNNPKLLLDFYAGISKKQFDSITDVLIEKELMEFVNDSTYHLVVPNEKKYNGIDKFDLKPSFRNDSLKAIYCYLREGYFPYYSYSHYFNDFKSLLTKKYGKPSSTYIVESKQSEDKKTNSKPNNYKYAFWIKDGLFVDLNEFSSSDGEKEYRSLYLQYSTVEYEKDLIRKIQKKEEAEVKKKQEEELKTRRNEIKSDSLRTEIF